MLPTLPLLRKILQQVVETRAKQGRVTEGLQEAIDAGSTPTPIPTPTPT